MISLTVLVNTRCQVKHKVDRQQWLRGKYVQSVHVMKHETLKHELEKEEKKNSWLFMLL